MGPALLCNFGHCDLQLLGLFSLNDLAQRCWQQHCMPEGTPVSPVKHYQFKELPLTSVHTPLLLPSLFCRCLQSVALSAFSLAGFPARHLHWELLPYSATAESLMTTIHLFSSVKAKATTDFPEHLR